MLDPRTNIRYATNMCSEDGVRGSWTSEEVFQQIHSLLNHLAKEDLSSVPAESMGEDQIALHRIGNRVQAEALRRLRRFDTGQGYASSGALTAKAWLRWRCNLTGPNASTMVEVSRQLSSLPQATQALADGDINCRREGIPLHQIGSRRQGIVHVIGPELGLTQPGMLIVCGDSHTSTHGAFGALAFGIGTSEVELVLATQCLPQTRARDLAVTVEGELPLGVTAKDVVLGIIGHTGTSLGQGHLVEYGGSTVRGLSMEGRMTICNMSIEWGAKAGMIAPDDTTFAYLERRPYAPRGAAWEEAVDRWRSLATDVDAVFDQEIHM